MKRVLFLISLSIFILFCLAACGGSSSANNASGLQITLVPPEGANPQFLVVQLADQAGKPVTNATVSLEGNMQHAGMAPVTGQAVQDNADGKEDGRYQVPFAFSMLGDWVITVSVKGADGKTAQRDIPVTVSDQGVKVK
ncbi:MAG: FixH family protein [Caldilineaceae bacterium]